MRRAKTYLQREDKYSQAKYFYLRESFARSVTIVAQRRVWKNRINVVLQVYYLQGTSVLVE